MAFGHPGEAGLATTGVGNVRPEERASSSQHAMMAFVFSMGRGGEEKNADFRYIVRLSPDRAASPAAGFQLRVRLSLRRSVTVHHDLVFSG
jgi:hypothetical protein